MHEIDRKILRLSNTYRRYSLLYWLKHSKCVCSIKVVLLLDCFTKYVDLNLHHYAKIFNWLNVTSFYNINFSYSCPVSLWHLCHEELSVPVKHCWTSINWEYNMYTNGTTEEQDMQLMLSFKVAIFKLYFYQCSVYT